MVGLLRPRTVYLKSNGMCLIFRIFEVRFFRIFESLLYYIFARIKPHACQWIPYTVWWPSMCLLNLAIQDVASMAAKTCSLGSLCKQYFILQLYSL